MPHFIEHHHVPRYRRCSRRRWHARPGRPARSGRFSLGLEPSGFRRRVRRRAAGLAQPRQSTRLHRPGPAASPARVGQSQAQVVSGAGRGGACRHRAAGRPRRTRRDRQRRDGLRQDHRWHRHGRRAARRRLPPHLVLSPPHLVYKWRREIQETVAGAKVWVLNGPDTLVKLIKLREQLGVPARGQEFFVLGRVRMRMGFHWKPVFNVRRTRHGEVGTCPDCGQVITNLDGEPINPVELEAEDYRRRCSHCAAPLWTLMRPRSLSASDQSTAVFKALQRIPTIGEVTAQKLMRKFGDSFLASMLGDNIHEFINLMDGNGELVFGSPGAPHGAGDGEHGVRLRRGRLPAVRSSSSATCRKARSTCSSPTRRTSTRTAAPHRAKRWGCWRPRHARRCCSPAR